MDIVPIEDPEWADKLLLAMATTKEAENPQEPVGWPVGTLIHNKANGRRGRIHSAHSNQVSCSIEFDDGAIWSTTWSVVLRNYTRI